MIVLGLHGGVTIRQHEASACLIVDGRVSALCEEERYTRQKGAYGTLPFYAIKACLKQAGIAWADVDRIVTPGSTYVGFDDTIRAWLVHNFGSCPPIERVHHQMAHLAAAFYTSPHERAVCLSLDATGDGIAGGVALADRNEGLRIVQELPTAHSIGFFYTLMTHYLGFADGDEYKVMGLAPYGRPNVDLSPILKPKEEGWELDRRYFRTTPPVQSPFEPICHDDLAGLLRQPVRLPGSPVLQFHKDVAASTQRTLEEAILRLASGIARSHPGLPLCYAGGVALNCAANAKLAGAGLFPEVHVPPVASDRGLALGCAYLGSAAGGDRPQPLGHAYLGSDYEDEAIEAELAANGCSYRRIADPAVVAADLIADGAIIGFFQGRSEAGARALGNRSILARPGGIEVKHLVNQRIKFREEFRPFAPAVQLERAAEHFRMVQPETPYMCFTTPAVAPDDDALGAVVHVDGTSRLQTMTADANPLFHRLLGRYAERSGVPVVLNTSFNLKGQPIVETPRDALMTFYGCGLDHLIVGNHLVSKPR